MKVQQVWTGPVDCCDICQTLLGGSIKEFIDGRTKSDSQGRGTWAIMCPSCFDDLGAGLGTGKGQRYRLETQDHGQEALYSQSRMWIKIEG